MAKISAMELTHMNQTGTQSLLKQIDETIVGEIAQGNFSNLPKDVKIDIEDGNESFKKAIRSLRRSNLKESLQQFVFATRAMLLARQELTDLFIKANITNEESVDIREGINQFENNQQSIYMDELRKWGNR